MLKAFLHSLCIFHMVFFCLVHNIGSIRLHYFSFVKELFFWFVLYFYLMDTKLLSKDDLSIRCKLYSIHVPNDILLSLKIGTTFTRGFQSQKDENWWVNKLLIIGACLLKVTPLKVTPLYFTINNKIVVSLM